MRTVPRVVIGDVLEIAHPAVDAEQIERCRANKVDRLHIRAEKRPYLGDSVQRATTEEPRQGSFRGAFGSRGRLALTGRAGPLFGHYRLLRLHPARRRRAHVERESSVGRSPPTFSHMARNPVEYLIYPTDRTCRGGSRPQ